MVRATGPVLVRVGEARVLEVVQAGAVAALGLAPAVVAQRS